MGKKGKGKKEKITGTPDVVKFKGQREFALLRECVAIQESFPFVISDTLDDQAFKKISRFLSTIGLLAEYSQAEAEKDYRFQYHHPLYEPVPQYFPFGYSALAIKSARGVIDNSSVSYNGKDYKYTLELKNEAEEFLKHVDGSVTKIASMIEPSLKDDFSIGLKKFKRDLFDLMKQFDGPWIQFEEMYLKYIFAIHSELFVPIQELIDVEANLTAAEENVDIPLKQKMENELVGKVEDFFNVLIPESAENKYPDDTMALAEAVLFYESKCSDKWQNQAKYLIKDFLNIRVYLTDLARVRMKPEFKANHRMMRILKSFHQSVLEAYEALEFVSKLPKLIHAKGRPESTNWMTRKLLLDDLEKQEEMRMLEVNQWIDYKKHNKPSMKRQPPPWLK